MKIVPVDALLRLSLGVQGENLVRQIAFDFTEWQKQYGEGQIQLQVQRHGDEAPYPVLLRVEGNLAVWSIERRDTEKEGDGELQLLYIVGGEQVAKSHIFSTFVEKALSKPGPVPPGDQSFGDKVALDATRAEAAAEKAGQVADEVKRLGQEVNVAAQQTARDAKQTEADAKQTAADSTASTMAKNQAIAAADAAAKDKAAAQEAAQQTKQQADAVNKTAIVVAQQAQETKGNAAIAQQAAQRAEDIIAAESGRKYELIEKITLSESTNAVKRTADLVGSPYNFRRIILKMMFKSSESGSIYIRNKNDSTLCAVIGAVKTQDNYVLTEITEDTGIHIANVGQSTDMWKPINMATLSFGDFNLQTLPLNGLTIACTSNMAAGTTIEIWAVRA